MGPMLRRLTVAAVGTTVLAGALAVGATAASAAPATSTAPVARDSDGITVFIDIDLDDVLCSLFEDFCDDDSDTDGDDGGFTPDVPGTGDDTGSDGGDDMTGPPATVLPEIPAGDGVSR